MKITKLLVLGALLLMGNSVAKAADWIARTAPTVSDVKAEPVTFEADHEYLLYNTGAKMFFSQGNAWGTRASGDAHQEHALRMYFTKYVPEAGEWDGKTYIFKIYSSVRSTTSYAWRDCFFDSNTAMFVDRASQANFYWEIQDMGGAIYRLKAAQANPDHKSDGTQFVGRDESVEHDGSNLSDNVYDPEAQPLSPLLTEGEGKHIDWVFYDAAVVGANIAIYEKAEQLKNLATSIKEKELGSAFNIDSYVALYNNSEATLEELEAAIEDATIWGQYVAIMEDAKAVAGTGGQYEDEYLEFYADYELDLSDNLAAHSLSKDELQALIDAIQKAIDEAYRHPKAGADMTNLLKNPNFTGNANGWTVEAVGGGNVAYGSNCYEAWNNGGFDVYQIVEDAPKGVYEISVQGFYRYGRNAYQDYLNQELDEVKPGKAPVYIYMNDNQTSFTNVYGDPVQITDPDFYAGTDFQSFEGADGVTYYFPSDMAGSAIAFSAGMYTQSAFGVVANEGDKLRIGAKGVSNQLGDSWCIWDNFKLTFQGYDNVATVQPILEKVLETSKELAKSAMGKSVKAKLDEAINNATAAISASEGEKMFDALSALLNINTVVTESIAIFTALETANDNLAAAIVTAKAGKDVITEADALYKEVSGKIAGGELENSDVAELQKTISDMIKKLAVPEEMAGASDANPVDCTSMIVNPDYENGNNDGWTLELGDKGSSYNAPAFNMGLIEAWNANFDEYQVLEELPEGTYTLTVQGFYRYGTTKNEYDTYTENPEANNYLSLYALVGDDEYVATMPRLASDGAQEHTSKVIGDDGKFVAGDDLASGDAWQWAWMTDPEANADSTAATGIRIANGMIPVATLFGEGKFVGTEVTFVVGEKGTARIGLKKQEEKNTQDSWSIWDNWKLTYYGPNSNKTPTETGIKDAADKAAVVKTEFFNVSGTRVNNAAKGIIIVKETLSNGAIKVKKVTVK